MTPTISLVRFAYTPMGVFGRLLVGPAAWYTVERPSLGNRPRVSCIPTGSYDLVLGTYHRGGYPAYEVLDVPGRSLIKIHRANTSDDVQGCIGVGYGLGFVAGRWAVTRSRRAFDEFMAQMGDAETARIVVSVDSA